MPLSIFAHRSVFAGVKVSICRYAEVAVYCFCRCRPMPIETTVIMQGMFRSLACFTVFAGVNCLYAIIAAVHFPTSFCSCRCELLLRKSDLQRGLPKCKNGPRLDQICRQPCLRPIRGFPDYSKIHQARSVILLSHRS